MAIWLPNGATHHRSANEGREITLAKMEDMERPRSKKNLKVEGLKELLKKDCPTCSSTGKVPRIEQECANQK